MAPPEDTPTVTRTVPPSSRGEGLRGVLRSVHGGGPIWSAWLLAKQGPQVIGRTSAPEHGEPLVHGTVSRRHAEISWSASKACHVLRDLGSHNGTRVDGHEVKERKVALQNQSVVQLGDVTLIYEALDPAAADPANAATASIPGVSSASAKLRAQVRQAAPDPSPALLIGETGTGKEWIAREVHTLSGRRGPFVAINCAALSPQLIDSQLFGHVRGAFTGAATDQPGLFRAAEGGTLFLDEIGELPLELQPKLLRALQEREVQPVGSTKLLRVDVRVVAATNRDLPSAVEDGSFRRDLYARLAMWEIELPAIRHRKVDIPIWIDVLHRRWLNERQSQAPAMGFSPEGLERLLLFDWQDNLRALDRLVHLLAAGEVAQPVALAGLPQWIVNPLPPAPSVSTTARQPAAGSKPPIPDRETFVSAYAQFSGNVRALAKHFARDRRQIYRWIEAHGLRDADD